MRQSVPSLETSPGLAALLPLSMLSQAGIPPLAGIIGKFLIFSLAAAEGHCPLLGIRQAASEWLAARAAGH